MEDNNNNNNSEEKHGIVYNICIWAVIIVMFGAIGLASLHVFEFIVESCKAKYGAENVFMVFAFIGGLFVLYHFIKIVFWIISKVISGVISDEKEKKEGQQKGQQNGQ